MGAVRRFAARMRAAAHRPAVTGRRRGYPPAMEHRDDAPLANEPQAGAIPNDQPLTGPAGPEDPATGADDSHDDDDDEDRA